MQQFRLSSLSLIVMTAIASQAALASGYHFGTQSIAAQSTSNASSAEAGSPATIFYNPAGLTRVKGTQVTANVVSVFPSVKYSNAKGSYFSGAPIAAYMSGSTVGTSATSGKITDPPVIVPHLYASHEITPQLTAGIGVYVPFGSSTEYEANSVMRYSVKATDLTTIDINPTIAYDFGNGHSIGVGVIGQFMKAELKKDVDFSTPFQAQQLPVPTGAADVGVDIKGDDWGFGYNLGWMWDINDSARVGVSYRSKIKHTLEGTAKWTPLGPAFADPRLVGAVRQRGYLPEENASVDIVTPESLSLHGMVKVNPQLDVFADVTWTKHSRFNNLNIQYQNAKVGINAQNPTQPAMSDTTSLRPNWRDTYKIGVGAAYQLNDQWQLRGGVAYDQSPVRSADDRLSTMPDNDRIWLSLGAKYDIDEHHSLNFAYSYLHIKNSSANTNGYCGGGIKAGPGAVSCVSDRTQASADYKSNAHIFGLQYTYRF